MSERAGGDALAYIFHQDISNHHDDQRQPVNTVHTAKIP